MAKEVKKVIDELVQFMWDNDMDLLLKTPFKQKIAELKNKR